LLLLYTPADPLYIYGKDGFLHIVIF